MPIETQCTTEGLALTLSSDVSLVESENVGSFVFPEHSVIEAPSRNFKLVKPLETSPATGRRPDISTTSTESLSKFIGLRMSELPTVERVYSKCRGRVFYTWIVIEQRDKQALRQIYEREVEVIKRFQDFGFDFYVIYRSGADIESLVSGDVELVFKKT